jgi:predicted MFS family arabinose efflux permease
MRNLIVAIIALILGGGAVIRNLLDDNYGRWTLADWALPVIFLLVGIIMLASYFTKRDRL